MNRCNNRIRIGIVQFNIEWENKNHNLEKLKRYAKEACENGVDVLFLPEMSFTGFSMNTKETRDNKEEIYNAISKISAENHIFIGFGWTEKSNSDVGLARNHYSVIGDTRVISDYIKIHPFSFAGECDYFEGGNKITNFYVNGIPFSNAICYDLRFPEIFQIISSKAHVIVVPACWPEKRRSHWATLLKARAIETQSYIVGINCVGEIGGLMYSGDSMIINPDGRVVAEANPYEESLVVYDLEDDVVDFRNSFPVKQDRKNELYKSLM